MVLDTAVIGSNSTIYWPGVETLDDSRGEIKKTRCCSGTHYGARFNNPGAIITYGDLGIVVGAQLNRAVSIKGQNARTLNSLGLTKFDSPVGLDWNFTIKPRGERHSNPGCRRLAAGYKYAEWIPCIARHQVTANG